MQQTSGSQTLGSRPDQHPGFGRPLSSLLVVPEAVAKRQDHLAVLP